jgi:hypothetical protein
MDMIKKKEKSKKSGITYYTSIPSSSHFQPSVGISWEVSDLVLSGDGANYYEFQSPNCP